MKRGVRYFPRLRGLPQEGMWQGEDRTFAILAQQNHQAQFADPWPDIFHAYHPDQRSDEVLQNVFCTLTAPSQKYTKHSDAVNFTLEALEEPKLKDRIFTIRGRLGGLEIAPNLEQLLLNLKVGEQVIDEIQFPFWWPEMAGQKRIVRVNLVDAKPFAFAPVLDEATLGGYNGH